MSTVLHAADVPAATRTDYWRQVIGDTIVPMDVRFAAVPGPGERLVAGELGPVRVIESTVGPAVVHRTPAHIRRSDPGLYQLFVQLRGQVVGEQDGRQVRLRATDLSLADLSRPFRCLHSAGRAVLISFPHELLPLRRAELAPVLGGQLPGDRGPGALVATLARQLPQHLDDGAGARVGSAVLDLLTAAVAAELDRTARVPAHTRRRALRLRVEAFVEANLADPGLAPADVAAAHNISLRALHRLFQDTPLGVAELIRHRRLERCRLDLLDPRLADRPVAAIAARWGLRDPAHFSRAFRAAYQLPPGTYRAALADR